MIFSLKYPKCDISIDYLFGTKEEQEKKEGIELNNNKIRKTTCIRLLVEELNKEIMHATKKYIEKNQTKVVDDLNTHLTKYS